MTCQCLGNGRPWEYQQSAKSFREAPIADGFESSELWHLRLDPGGPIASRSGWASVGKMAEPTTSMLRTGLIGSEQGVTKGNS